jgi:hypothetical protein
MGGDERSKGRKSDHCLEIGWGTISWNNGTPGHPRYGRSKIGRRPELTQCAIRKGQGHVASALEQQPSAQVFITHSSICCSNGVILMQRVVR